MSIPALAELSSMNLEAVPLDHMALSVAQDHYPDIDCFSYLKRLDDFAERAQHHINGVAGAPAIAKALSHYLFEEEGFRGNKHNYYSASNSYFNDVLDQRIGIPITLSILYIAVCQRLKLPVCGVSFPGHFLVQYSDPRETFYIDAFSQGKLLSLGDCRRRWNDQFGDSLPFNKEFLRPATHREILIRILSNLKLAYTLVHDFEAVLRTLGQMLLFSPDGTEIIKERGLLYFHLECFRPALEDLEEYLTRCPTADDRPIIEDCITDLKDRVGHIL